MRVEDAGRMARLGVVIDTNVWISAVLVVDGAPARVVRHALEHGLPVMTDTTFSELQTRLWRPKFDRYLSIEVRQRLLHDIDAVSYWVAVKAEIAARAYCRDPDDDKFIHTALTAEAGWLITGDQDLLAVSGIPGLRILTPSAALQHPGFCR